MSKNTRDFDARNRDRRQALEKKKVIAVGLLGPRPRAAAVEVVPANKEIGNCTPLAAPETVLRYASRGSLLSVFSSHTGAPLTLSDGLLDVVNLYLDVAHSKKAAFGLLWPGVLTNLPLTHALATTSRWMEGYKNGLRGLLFPSKANTFYVLDHLYFDADQLLRLADEFLEPVGRDVNPRVRQSLRDKDPFLFFLGTLRKAVQGRELRPCINELLPHFDVGEVELNLRNYGGEFFEHLIGRIRDRSYKKALTSTFESIGDPRRAPDALFALTYKVSAASYREKLRLIEKCGQQDVVLVDATRRGRRALPNWRRQIPSFIDAVADVYGEKRPGLLVITDDPRCMTTIRYQLAKNQAKTREHRPPPTILDVRATNWPGTSDGLAQPSRSPYVTPEPRRYRVRVTDSVMASVIQRLRKVTNDANFPQETARPLRAASDFLTRLSALPCGIQTLGAWLTDREFAAHAREHFTWPSYRADLLQLVQRPEAALIRGAVQEIISDVGKVWESVNKATPLALLLTDEIDQAANSSKRITVVFTRDVYKTLAQRFVQDYKFSNGKRFEEFSDRVRFLRSDDLASALEEGWTSRFVFSGVDEESLRLLVIDNRISADSCILLSHQAALYLKSALEPLIAFEAFKIYRPRIEGLLSQISATPGFSSAALAADDFVQPSFSFGVSQADLEEIDASEAWMIELEDGRRLIRRGTTRLYVYQPQHPDAGVSGFRSVVVSELQEEHRLFCMSEDLREQVEEELKRAGVDLAHDRPFEVVLREYHAKVMGQVSRFFAARSLEGQVRCLRDKIERQNPSLKDLPRGIRNWVNLGKNANVPFEELMPQAPRKFGHFQAFAKALDFTEAEITYYWGAVINPIRSNRIRDGRYVSEIYARSLFDPEETMVYHKVERAVLAKLYTKALESVFEVTAITPPVAKVEQ